MKFSRPAAAALLGVFLAACDIGTGSTPVDMVIIEAFDADVAIGEARQLTATAYDGDGNEITGRAVEWSASNPAVATISDDGVLTGLTLGRLAVTAEIAGARDHQQFTVIEPFGDCPVANHALGSTTAATLTSPDCRNVDNRYTDIYRMSVSTRREVTITMRSAAVDSYLFLVNAAADRELAQDNDSGGGKDARIVATLDPGTYIIVTTAYSPGNGPYTLTTQ
ncbi:MAG TPA: Ig-like domain-containing protein [Longimicrobium sp.]|jgi:hypothetical protein|uniref:Ig-like domain-containing protein n=1 Tax=Longimicrobium sp. TaxID=2029185 RepID=UPI002ED8E67A